MSNLDKSLINVVLANLRKLELAQSKGVADISAEDRFGIVDGIFGVCSSLNLSNATSFLAVAIFERALLPTLPSDGPCSLAMCALACIMLASKLDDPSECTPSPSDLLATARRCMINDPLWARINTCEARQLEAYERRVLMHLGFDILFVTSTAFADTFLSAARAGIPDEYFASFVERVVSLMSAAEYCARSLPPGTVPSARCAAAIFAARLWVLSAVYPGGMVADDVVWPPEAVTATGYPAARLRPAATALDKSLIGLAAQREARRAGLPPRTARRRSVCVAPPLDRAVMVNSPFNRGAGRRPSASTTPGVSVAGDTPRGVDAVHT